MGVKSLRILNVQDRRPAFRIFSVNPRYFFRAWTLVFLCKEVRTLRTERYLSIYLNLFIYLYGNCVRSWRFFGAYMVRTLRTNPRQAPIATGARNPLRNKGKRGIFALESPSNSRVRAEDLLSG